MEDSSPLNAQRQSESSALWEMMEAVKKQRKVGVRYLKECERIEMHQKIGLEKGARGIISVSRKYGVPDSDILEELQSQLDFSADEARRALVSYDAEHVET